MNATMSYSLSRWVWMHAMRIMYAGAGLFFAFGLIGPRYGSVLAVAAFIAARAGLAVGFALSLVLMFIRRKRAGFSFGQFVSDYHVWSERNVLSRMGITVMFLSLGGMMAALGGLIGTIGVYFVWRAT